MIRYHSNDSKLFTCKTCEKSFHLERDLKQHKQSHKTKNVFTCKVCKLEYSSKVTLNEHGIVHDEDLINYKCDKCDKGFYSRGKYNQHVKSHYSYKCEECRKMFSSKLSLKKHISCKHSIELNFRCDVCPNKAFVDRHRLNTHKKRKQHKERMKTSPQMTVSTMDGNDGVIDVRSKDVIAPINHSENVKSNEPSSSLDTAYGTLTLTNGTA